MLLIEQRLGFRYGGSSGTNLVACLRLAVRMRARGERGSIVIGNAAGGGGTPPLAFLAEHTS